MQTQRDMRTFITSLLSFVSTQWPLTLLYSCLYWRKYCQDEPHERIRYVSQVIEEIYRHRPGLPAG